MTEALERLADEVRKLTPAEVTVLRDWLAAYQPDNAASTGDRRADWAGHADRVRKIFAGLPPLEENVVLRLREEERF